MWVVDGKDTAMPAGNSHRLEAVLRAGQHKKPASTTGENINTAGADALKANPPTWGKGADAKKDNESSAWLEDLVNSYKEESKGRSETLEAVRKDAQDCVEKRNTAVNEAMQEQEAAATKIVEALKDKLNQVSAELEQLRSASADNTTQKDACEDARASLERSLEKCKEDWNRERDEAAREAAIQLEKTVQEWTTKLKEVEAANASSGADASKKLEECIAEKAAAEKALVEEQEINAKHLEDAATNAKKFQTAIEEACARLKEALA